MGLLNFVKNLLPSVDDIKKAIFKNNILQPKTDPKAFRWDIGNGKGMTNVTTVKPGPLVSTSEAMKRGETIKPVTPTTPPSIAPKTIAKAVIQKNIDIAKTEEKPIPKAIRVGTEIAKDQIKQTKESLPYLKESLIETTKKAPSAVASFVAPAITNFTKKSTGIIGESIAYAIDPLVREMETSTNGGILSTVNSTSAGGMLKDTLAAGIEASVFKMIPSTLKANIVKRFGVGALGGVGFAVSQGLANDETPEQILENAKSYGAFGAAIEVVAPYLLPVLRSELKNVPQEVKNAFKGLMEETKDLPVGMSIKDVSKDNKSLAQEATKYKSAEEAGIAFKKMTGDNAEIAGVKMAGAEIRKEAFPYTAEQMKVYDSYQALKYPSSKYLYHTTPAENIASIKEKGLITGQKPRFEGVSSPDKISLSASEEAAKYYGSNSDVMIRVNKKYAKTIPDLEGDYLAGGSGVYTTGKNIPPEMLEVKINGKWQPLNQSKAVGEVKPIQEAEIVIPKTTAEVKKNVDVIGDELNAKMVDQTFRSDKLNLPEEMTKEVEKRLSALGLEQRTVKTFGEMGDAAMELGSDPKTLLREVSSNRITDAQVVALRNTINNNKQFISQALERIKTNPEMEEVLMGQIDTASAQIDQALGKIVKGGTEAGRAVVAFKILAQNTLDPIFWETKLKRVLGGKELTLDMQRAIMEFTANKDINGLANYVAMNIGSTFSEKAVTLWKAGLLTSLTTHIANTTGNVTMRILMDASDVVALPLDVLASLITGKRTKLINVATINAEIMGSLKGIKEAGRYMWTGNYSEQFLKKWDLPKNINFKNKILDTYTKTIFKALGAEDIVFRQMAIEKAFSEQAQLIARNEKLTGNAFQSRVKELLTTPTNEMVLNAIDAAEYATFQSKSAIGDAVVGAKRALARNDSPAAKATLVGLEILTPFTKTPSNIISRIVDFSPAGFIKAIVKAVNPTTRSQKAIVEDLSRAITGTGVMALGYLLAEQGFLTGGTPEDAKDRSTLYYKGQASSILINGEWRELKRVSPIGNILIMGADIYDLYQNQGKRGTDLASSAAFSGLQNLTEQSFLRGVSGGLDALMSPDRSAEKFVKQTTASLVPSIVTRIAKSMDPTLRESDNIMEAVQERLPILREKLAPVRDIFGEVAKVPAGSKYWFDPFSSKKDKSNEPIIVELTKLKHPIGMPEQKIDGVKMNSYEYSEYQRYNGKMLKPVLNALISSDEYQTLNSDEKKQVIDQAITTIRQGINETVFPALMMVRYNLDKDTDPGVLRELMRQLDSRPGYSKKSDDEKATIMKKFLYGLKDQL